MRAGPRGIWRWHWLLAGCIAVQIGASVQAGPAERLLPLAAVRPAARFSSADLRALQASDDANPAMLWVVQGQALWRTPAGVAGASCAGCHGDAAVSMRGVAARYPALEPSSDPAAIAPARLLNLEGRINQCRSRHQGLAPWPAESQPLLGVSAYVAMQSRGQPLQVSTDAAIQPYLERGRALYLQRSGQMNLACTHCHDRHWGDKLLGETISQGHGNGYPAYRLEWQGLGSLQRRLRACQSGIRAEMLPFGSPALVELELFLAWRAGTLAVETPAVRR